MPKKWYSTKETCEHLGIHRHTLRLRRTDGTIPKKCWIVTNPNAVRLTYKYDALAIEKIFGNVTQAPSQKAKVLGTQPAFLKGVKSYSITAE